LAAANNEFGQKVHRNKQCDPIIRNRTQGYVTSLTNTTFHLFISFAACVNYTTESNGTVSAPLVPNDDVQGTANQTSDSTASVKEPSDNTASSKSSKMGWRLPFRKKSSPESSLNETESTTVAAPLDTTAAAGGAAAVVPTSNSTTDAAPSANVTGSPEPHEQQPSSSQHQHQQQQQQQGLATLGPPVRTTTPGRQAATTFVVPNNRSFQRRTRPPASRDHHSPANYPPQPPVAIPEVVGSIASAALRLMFLTWVTKRMATQEESIHPSQHYCWERLNDRFSRDTTALQTVLNQPPMGVPLKLWQRHVRRVNGHKAQRITAKDLAAMFTRTVIVVELNTGSGSVSGDPSSSVDLRSLPEVVTFILQQQLKNAFGTCKETNGPMELEVVFAVDSPGGGVATYGLAAAQLRRLKSGLPHSANITTTVCVDKCAASGGYMIASQADKLVAAPFATLGSVGVISEGLNFNELAKRYGVLPMIVKAGDSKNPLSTYGPVSKQDLELEQLRLVKVHDEFKALILRCRPGLAEFAEQVMDGSVFMGSQAKSLGMVDKLMTTDEYILERIEAGDRVLKLHRTQQGRYPRNFNLNPLDILPHIKSWATSAVSKLQNSDEACDLLARLVKAGSWLSFLNHIYQVYGRW
jgi:ClpP class serine protease